MPAAQVMHRIIRVPPASEAIKRSGSSRVKSCTSAEARLPVINTSADSAATRRQLRRPIHHHAGSVARLMAPSSVENRRPICAGPSCHCAASWAATAGAVIRMPGAMAAKTIMAVSSRGGQGSAAPAAGAETESLDINLIPQALSDDEISRPARLRAGGSRAINGEYVLALVSGRRQRRPLSGVNRERENRRRPVRCGSPRRFWRKYCAYGFSP